MLVAFASSSQKELSPNFTTIPLVIPAVPKGNRFIQTPQAHGVIQHLSFNWLRKQQFRDCWVDFNGYEWQWRSRIGHGIYEKKPKTIPIHPASRIEVALDSSYFIIYDGAKPYTFYSDNVAQWTLALTNAMTAQVLLQQYKIGISIGCGGSSSVYCLENNENDIVKLSKITQRQAALNEIELLEYLNAVFPAHSHLPSLLRAFETKEATIGLVFQKYNGGTLFDRMQTLAPLSTTNVRAREHSANLLIKTLLQVLKDLHGAGIVHLDIKPSNIMFAEPNSGLEELILIDFGIAQRMNQSDNIDSIGCGTPGHMAPELLSFKASPILSACDVFSAGVLLYTYLLGVAPFRGSTTEELIERMIQGRMCRPSNLWQLLSTEATEFLIGMLDRDPVNRLSIDQLLTHTWLN
ncbi:kinase [Thraustotheca clavata]|uniref:Kinase n=1 Tax=Thraustotheca clavata TaxID=74557 RepID=A0A1V9ZDN2_9STRA|nr:kinase [Thraustotheca clavata]